MLVYLRASWQNINIMLNNKKKVYPGRSRRVLVAMSGGVDSSVAVLILKKQGYEVSGAYMKCWPEYKDGRPCTTPKDNLVALQAAAHLDIPFMTFNFEKEYRQKVFQYFIDEYAAGRTPNPDVMCNKYIKFGLFLDKAKESGFDYVATGHYVRTKSEGLRLYKAKDLNKDQSYFLYTLTQEQLRYCLFPIGDYTKPEVRQIAKEQGLPNADKKDSQGLCFVGHIDLPEVLGQFMKLENGAIVNSQKQYLGKHIGLNAYTIGQRSRLGIGGTGPYFVAAKNYEANTLIVAKEGEPILYKDLIKLTDVYWIAGEPKLPAEINVKIRYRQPDVAAVIDKTEAGWIVKLLEPQKGVAEGQALVFYSDEPFDVAQGKEMLGGGIIAKSSNERRSLMFYEQSRVT